MGAWGYKVLDNDGALDALSSYLDSTVKFNQFLNSLLSSDYDDEQLLGVAIVVVSKQGLDLDWDGILGSYYNANNSYNHFFESLPVYYDYYCSGFETKAKQALQSLIEYGVEDWSADVQEDRMELYQTLNQYLG